MAGNWEFLEKLLFCYPLFCYLGCRNLPAGLPGKRIFPGELGRQGAEGKGNTIFAKACFRAAVAKWSPKQKHQPGFLIAYLAFLGGVLCSVYLQVVGSSPTGGAILIGQKCNLCQKALFYKAFSVFQDCFLTFCFLQLFPNHRGLNLRHINAPWIFLF